MKRLDGVSVNEEPLVRHGRTLKGLRELRHALHVCMRSGLVDLQDLQKIFLGTRKTRRSWRRNGDGDRQQCERL